MWVDFSTSVFGISGFRESGHSQVNMWSMRAQGEFTKRISVWFLVGNGGMGYGDSYWGLSKNYYRDPFPHSLLRTRQILSRGAEPPSARGEDAHGFGLPYGGSAMCPPVPLGLGFRFRLFRLPYGGSAKGVPLGRQENEDKTS